MSKKANKIDSLINTYLETSALRPELLFRHFLPAGYRETTLDSVIQDLFDTVIYAKLHLGMIITLYDDFADHPKYRNTQLLKYLYQLNVGVDSPVPTSLTGDEFKKYALACSLFSSLEQVLEGFPNCRILLPALRFDIEQFYACNRHSELMGILPSIRNLTESRTFGPHNMGIVAAGTIDLMASSRFDLEELGLCREAFILGQRLGRTSNLIFTLQRELSEGDSTNEILISMQTRKSDEVKYQSQLMHEFANHLEEIRAQEISSFSPSSYARGFEKLHELHASFLGKI